MSSNRDKPIKWVKEGDCIRCTNHVLDSHGYPRKVINKIDRKIARWILIKRLGAISTRVVCRHTCDNRWCISPAHIIHGTLGDNNRDTVSRGRRQTKLTKEEVLEIRRLAASGITQERIAGLFNIGQIYVSRIHRRILWKHLKD